MINLDLILRLGAASCFLGHGVLALQSETAYLELLGSFGIPESVAVNVLFTIGCLDVLVGLMILFKPYRVVLYWAIAWTSITIIAWAIQETSFWDLVRRFNYTMMPLALLMFTMHRKKNTEDSKPKEDDSDEANLEIEKQIDLVAQSGLDENIAQLDFSMLKMKLMELEEGEGWTAEQCDEVELEYKRYLQLKLLYPDEKIVPNQAIDTMWHYHILDTEAYHQDCDSVFGFFMHHYPYFGMNGKSDERRLMSAFENTQMLYEKTFGNSMLSKDYLQSFNDDSTSFDIVIG